MSDINTAAGLGGAAGVGFMVGGPVGAVVGAGLELAIPIIQGILQNNETDRVNKQNLGIYNQERGEKLAGQRQAQQNWQKEMDVSQQNTAFNQQQTKYGNAVNKEQTAFDRQKQAYDNAFKLLSTQQGLTQERTAPFIKRV